MIIFGLILTTFELSIIFKPAGAVLEIGSSLKPNHHCEIQLAQIHETLCSIDFRLLLSFLNSSIFKFL